MPDTTDLDFSRNRNAGQVAMTALQAGRTLMETGASASVVRQGMRLVAEGLGADNVHSRIGFASLAITLSLAGDTTTRMLGVGAHGVNIRLNNAVKELCVEIARKTMNVDEAMRRLAQLPREIPRHSPYLMSFSAGLACACFGRLLGIDWTAFAPILVAGTIAQYVRIKLIHSGFNGYILAAIVAFIASTLAGFSSLHLGSGTVETAMIAAVLMLVPGVQALNAQTDIMEHSPTLGSARAVTVFMILVFLTVGVGGSKTLIGIVPTAVGGVHHGVLHQAFFGAIAAAGFGVLFNFAWKTLILAAIAGAIALAIRTLGLDAGWSLEGASFAAAASVGICVEVYNFARKEKRRLGNALALAGCIPMIPGAIFANWIIGLLELSAPNHPDANASLMLTMGAGVRVIFTIGAIGAGLTIVTLLLRRSAFPK